MTTIFWATQETALPVPNHLPQVTVTEAIRLKTGKHCWYFSARHRYWFIKTMFSPACLYFYLMAVWDKNPLMPCHRTNSVTSVCLPTIASSINSVFFSTLSVDFCVHSTSYNLNDTCLLCNMIPCGAQHTESYSYIFISQAQMVISG